MKELLTLLTVLLFGEVIIQTTYGVTPEDTKTFCSLTSSFCSPCQNLCSKNITFLGKTRYSSGCGEYCDKVNGTIAIIDFSGKGLTELGVEVGVFTNLTRLDLSHNSLTSLPDSVCDLEKLSNLHLNNNKLGSLPDELGDLVELRSLTIFNNSLTALPESFGNLTKLTSLSLEGNPIEALPESFGSLASLRTISFDSEHRALKCLPKSFFNLDLSTLDVHNNRLNEVPAELGNMRNLLYLDLSHNDITGLPETLGSLSSLFYLDVSHNTISALPDAFDSLSNLLLRNFVFDHNNLTGVPKSFGRDLSYQCFDEIPEIISEFSYVNGLNMSHNNIGFVPAASMELRALDLSYNNMKKIPEGLRLFSVGSLDLSFNKLTSVDNLPHLMYTLDISNNFITEITPDQKKSLPGHLNIDYNYLECSKYKNSTWEPIKSYCSDFKQFKCFEKSIEDCEEFKDEYGICSPNSNNTVCLRYTNGAREFCEFAEELGIDDCQDIYPDGICKGISELYGFIYDCKSDKVTEYRPTSMEEFITEVPDSAINFTSLTTLTITGLNLTELPISYENFIYVNTLNLTRNKLTDIPEVAYNLENLEYLDISYNRLWSLPDDFFIQTDLKLFYAHHNFVSNISSRTYTILRNALFVNVDYNFINCSPYYYYDRICDSNYQFRCGWVGKEECIMNITEECIYNYTLDKCIEEGYYDKKEEESKLSAGTIAAIVVSSLIYVVMIILGIINGIKTTIDEEKKKKKNGIDLNGKVPNANPPPQNTVPLLSQIVPYAPIPTPVIRSRMEVAPTFYETYQPGLNSIYELYTDNAYGLKMDISRVLERAGCSSSDKILITQKIVSWTRKAPCDPPLTLRDAEVLGVFTYDYGDDFRDISPTFKLCHAMNIQDEQRICEQKELLFLVLSSLRKLPLTNFKDRKMYFAINSLKVYSMNFAEKRMIKIMPFLTLYSSRDVAMSILNGSNGVIFEVISVEGYDITNYSFANPRSFGTEEVVMEPESVFRIEGFREVSHTLSEVSLMYIREESEFPLANVIGNNPRY